MSGFLKYIKSSSIRYILFVLLLIGSFICGFFVSKIYYDSDNPVAYADEVDQTNIYSGEYRWIDNPAISNHPTWYTVTPNFYSGGQAFDSIVVSHLEGFMRITLNYHLYDQGHNYTVAYNEQLGWSPTHDYQNIYFQPGTVIAGATSDTWLFDNLKRVEPTSLSTPTNFYFDSTNNLLRWSAVPYADGYQIISNHMTYAIDSTSNFFQPVGDGNYKVRAYRNTDEGLIFSEWSNLVAVSTPVQTSLDLRFSNELLSWNRISDAVRYQIVYSPVDFPSDFVDRLSDYITTYVDNFSYSPQFDGYYCVVAYSENGNILQISSSLRVNATGNNQIYASSPLLLFIQPVYSFMSYPFFGVSLNQVFGVVMFVLVATIFLKLFAGG